MIPIDSFSNVKDDWHEKIAIISDIHGNSPALKAVLEDISYKGCSHIYLLGDIINGIDPHTCLEIIREDRRVVGLKGNAEFYVLTPDLEEFPKRNEPMYHELIPLLQWFISQLSEDDLEWLQSLPDSIVRNGTCFIHDSPLDRLCAHNRVIPRIGEKYQELCFHSNGITSDMPEADWESLCKWMDMQSLSQVFCGHTHKPFYKKLGTKLICNVGSVGLPLDGDPRPSWVMLENEPGKESFVTIQRVAYDIEQMLHIVDEALDYPDFKIPINREAYKKTVATGCFCL